MDRKTESPALLLRFFDSFLQDASIKWLLALGMLILLGSSLLLVAGPWQQATPVWQYVIFLGYGAALFGSGEWTYHRLGLRRTGSVLQGLIVLLVPILFLLLDRAPTREAMDIATRLLLGALTLAFSVVAAGRIFGHCLRGSQPTFLASYLILALAGAVLPWLADAWRPAAALGLWGVFAVGTMKVNRHVFWLTEERRQPRVLGFFPIALLGGQFLVLYALFAAAHVGLDWLGVGCVLVALPVLAAGDAVARVFQARTGDLVRPLPWSVLAPLIVGLALGATGVCLAGTGLVPPNRPHALVIATALGTALLALVARRTGKAAFVWAMLVGLTAAYVFSPAFFRDMVRVVLDRGAVLVHEQRLPLAFYGLTCLPLVAGLMAGATWLGGRSALFAVPMRRYAVGIACLLLALSLGHAKAIFPVGAVMTLVFAAQVVLFRSRWPAIAAVLAWGLGAFGLAGFLTGVLNIRVPAEFPFHCLTGAAALLLAASRWLDRWLGEMPPARGCPDTLVRFLGFGLALGLAGVWIAGSMLYPGAASLTTGAPLVILLLAVAVLCRQPGMRWPALVGVNWLALAFLPMQPPQSLLPVAFLATASLLPWQLLVARLAAPWNDLVRAHLWLLRGLAVRALCFTLILPALEGIDVLLVAGAFILAALAEGIAACRDRREARAWIALGVGGAGVAYLAWFHVFPLGSGLGMFVTLGIAIALWLGKEIADRQERLAALRRPLRWTAFALPLVAVGLGVFRHLAYAHPAWLGANSLALLLAGSFYFWRGVEDRRKELVLLAGVILNVALALLCRELSWTDPQLFMIPIGITILALVQLFKEEIPERWHDAFRYAGALVILVSPVFHIVGGSWVHLMTLMLASVGVVLVAIGLRVRALMYTGTAFLLADLVAMIVRGSMDSTNVLWVAGLTLGTAVLVLAAACERNREALLQRMRVLTDALKQWE